MSPAYLPRSFARMTSNVYRAKAAGSRLGLLAGCEGRQLAPRIIVEVREDRKKEMSRLLHIVAVTLCRTSEERQDSEAFYLADGTRQRVGRTWRLHAHVGKENERLASKAELGMTLIQLGASLVLSCSN